ncbi:hypothetical protein Pfo_006305 [Paulownia fortunei]|nr:hypothetical protein Pfo_006305 [Paulownia fortunei]
MNSYSYSFAAVFLLVILNVPCEAQLSPTFYNSTCPNALSRIRTSIRQAVSRERRMAASLIRLHFHDCFVQGCDASILLDDSPSITGEKFAAPNNGSARGYEVIEAAKREVENICPGVVSCADVLAVAARDASAAVGGPSWTVTLGRRDSTTASRSLAESNLPSFRDPLERLISNFRDKGLSERDLVALSGAHTIGQAQCFLFRDRIYSNGSDIDAGFASTRRRQCPTSGGDNRLAPLDLVTPNSFDNNYFRNLVQRRGLLESDQVLFSGGSTDGIVTEYSNNPGTFSSDFAAAMVRMGDIEPLTGQNGIIRRTCGAVN